MFLKTRKILHVLTLMCVMLVVAVGAFKFYSRPSQSMQTEKVALTSTEVTGSFWGNWSDKVDNYADVTEIIFVKEAPDGYSDSGKAMGNTRVYRNDIDDTKIAFVCSGIIVPTSCQNLFQKMSQLTTIIFGNFSTDNVTNMTNMFYNCPKLTFVDMSGLSTPAVTNMSYMFYGCEELAGTFGKDGTAVKIGDNFDTSKVTDMSYMFYNCSKLTFLDLSKFSTPETTRMCSMFRDCSGLIGTFGKNGTAIKISDSFNTSKVTDLGNMFDNCIRLTSIDLSGFDMVKVTNMSQMFNNCQGLAGTVGKNGTAIKISNNLSLPNVTNLSRIFYGCKQITSVDLSGMSVPKILALDYMIYMCTALTSVNLFFDILEETTIIGIFSGCSQLNKVTASESIAQKMADSTINTQLYVSSHPIWYGEDGTEYDKDNRFNTAGTYTTTKLQVMVCEVTTGITSTRYDSIEDAWSVANSTGTAIVKLLTDVEISSHLIIQSGNNIMLDLNGHILKLKDAGSDQAIEVDGTFTLEDSDKTTSHMLTNPINDLPIQINGGLITGNNAYGVYVNGGKFIMNDGTIFGNSTGVYVDGNFTMTNGTICANTAQRYGGGVYVYRGMFDMYDGEITGNTAIYSGGGVYVDGTTFNMYGGEITDNISQSGNGGGVTVRNGEFIMTNGTISANTAQRYGGGVYMYQATFTMEGGTINLNSAVECDGGGVYAYGNFNIKGAVNITKNEMGRIKNNVYVTESTLPITVTGALEDQNGNKAQIGVSLDTDVDVFTTGYGVNNYNGNVFLKPWLYFISDNESYVPTLSDDEVILTTPVAVVKVEGTDTYYADILDAWNAAKIKNTTAIVTMLADINIEETLLVESFERITLDLNGYKLEFTGTSGSVILVKSGLFTLNDKNKTTSHTFNNPVTNEITPIKGGLITGGVGTASTGGGVHIDGGNFRMNGGSIAGNTAIYGGGVCAINNGIFSMLGGTILGNKAGSGGGVAIISSSGEIFGSAVLHGVISGNYADQRGGGVFISNNGEVTLSDTAVISDNTATDGGGVYIYYDSTDTQFTMEGGSVSNNTALNGGGVYVGSEFRMEGGSVSNNKASADKGIGVGGVFVDSYGKISISGNPKIKDNKYGDSSYNLTCEIITINGALTDGAEIHISNTESVVIATGFTAVNNPNNKKPSEIFISDDKNYSCVYISDTTEGNVKITTHTGGTATCQAKAVCTNCGESYGEFGAHSYQTDYEWNGNNCTAERICEYDSSHKETETVTATLEAVAPTCTTGGYDLLTAEFENTAFETQTMKINEMDNATGHNYDENGVCTTCGEKIQIYWGVSEYWGDKILTISMLESDVSNANVMKGSFDYDEIFDEYAPWYDHHFSIGRVEIKDGVAPKSTKRWFYSFSINEIDLSTLDTSKTITMEEMFESCYSLESITFGKSFNTTNVTNMDSMFDYCENLISLDLSTFDTSNVTTMFGMFYHCENLISLDLSTFDTSNVTTMFGMFYHCENLTFIDLSSFNTESVTNMYSMFSNCSGLTGTFGKNGTAIKIGDNFNTKNVETMFNLFGSCTNLTSIDLSSFDTSKVTNMQQMFYHCENLTFIDLSSFDTSNVTNMIIMFTNCNKLRTIKTPKIMNETKATLPAQFWNGETNVTEMTSTDQGKTLRWHEDHTYDWVIVEEATCTEAGSKKEVCFCGVENGNTERIEAIGHNYGEPEWIWSDDSKTASVHFTCANDNTHIITGNAIITSVVKTEATCETMGTTTYTATFMLNEDEYTDTKDLQDIPVLGHNYGEVTYTWLGTNCTAERICEHDRNHKESEIVTATLKTVEPSCTTGGYDIFTAEFVNTAFATQIKRTNETGEKGHSYGEWQIVTEATCSAEGSKKHVCTVCGHEETEDIAIDENAHSWREWTESKAATCTEKGEETRVCNQNSEHKETRETDANGHSWNEMRTEPTCTTDGSVIKTCTVCGATTSEVLPALGHDLIHHEAKQATCTENGWNAYETCSRCDHSTYEEISSLGHDYGEWMVVRESTIDEFGEERRVCAHDGTHFETRELPKRVPKLVKPDESDGQIDEIIVTIPNGFDPNVELIVTKISQDNYAKYEMIAAATNGQIGLVYDVVLKSDGVTIQPDGMLTIKLRIPENLKEKTFKLFHLHEETATDMEYTVEGDYAVLTTDKLSEFIFIGENNAPASITTGFNPLWMILIIILAVVITGEVGYIVYRKVFQKKISEVRK